MALGQPCASTLVQPRSGGGGAVACLLRWPTTLQPRRNHAPMAHAPNSLAARDIAYLIHPYTNLRVHEKQGPLVITKGKGVWVEDDDGKQYIEGLAGLWCTALGFDNKRLVEAARHQMETMPYSHQFSHRSTMP